MATQAEITTAINTKLATNGTQAITATLLGEVLETMNSSLANLTTHASKFGVNPFDPSVSYAKGAACFHPTKGTLLRANKANGPGVLDETDWDDVVANAIASARFELDEYDGVTSNSDGDKRTFQLRIFEYINASPSTDEPPILDNGTVNSTYWAELSPSTGDYGQPHVDNMILNDGDIVSKANDLWVWSGGDATTSASFAADVAAGNLTIISAPISWVTGTAYYKGQRVKNPTGGNVYLVDSNHTSAASIATDIGAGRLVLESIASEGGIPKATQTLGDAATITWPYLAGLYAQVTPTDDRTLAVTGDSDGDVGLLKVTCVAERTLTLPSGDKMVNSGAGEVTLPTGEHELSFKNWGTHRNWNVGNLYTAAP